MIDAKEHFKGVNFQDRVCIPAFERIKHLYALGYSNGAITQTIVDEFQDIEPSPITQENVRRVITNNKEDFENYRIELAESCRKSYKTHTIALFEITQKNELRVVEVYNDKITEALNELATLSLGEQDDKQNYLNTSRIFVLMEFIEKFHKKASEFIGTQAMREVEIYRQKMAIKVSGDTKINGLTPAYGDIEAEQVMPTRFLG